jgi:hypothetical protein
MYKITQLIPCSLEDKCCIFLRYIVPVLWIDWSYKLGKPKTESVFHAEALVYVWYNVSHHTPQCSNLNNYFSSREPHIFYLLSPPTCLNLLLQLG